jgi:hypothetical protein
MPLLLRLYSSTIAAAAVRLGAFSLTPPALMESAARKAGLDDFGSGSYVEGLDALCRASRSAELTAFGRQVLFGIAELALVNRLRLVEMKKARPDVFEAPLRPPIVITGLPRSGTTLMHRVLASDPASASIPYHRLVEPLPNPHARRDDRRRRHALNVAVRRALLPELDRIHHLRVDSPEECMFALAVSFESMLFWVAAPLYDYLDWYLARERDAKYVQYRDLLHIWQAESPGSRLVLKAPAHADALAALTRHVPEALIVQTHRDMDEITASSASLLYETHRMTARRLDPQRLGTASARLLREMERRNRIDRARGVRVFDVQYRDLVRDPAAAVYRIYAHYHLPMTDAFRADLERAIAAHPQHASGRHVYAPDDFGLARHIGADRGSCLPCESPISSGSS